MARGGGVEAAKVLTKKICHYLLFSTFGITDTTIFFHLIVHQHVSFQHVANNIALSSPLTPSIICVTTFQRSTYRKIQAKELGNNFRAVTEIVEARLDDLLSKMQPDSIVTKNHYVAINASDVNFTNGKYTPDVKP
jgi:hypothetical protein